MDQTARVRLLAAQPLFSGIPEERLGRLADALEPRSVPDGEAFIVEGAPSDGMYFVESGRARVAKRLAGGEKDLAFVGPGECLGEMELVRGAARSASAYAQGPVALLRLKTDVLRAWLDADAPSAAGFYARLAEIQSARLRRTSDEVALLYDLSQLLVTPRATAKDLLARALERVVPHLQGEWSAEARAYNQFEDEMELAARRGAALGPDAPEPAPKGGAAASWRDERTIELALSAPKRPLGLLRFRAAVPLSDSARAEAGRTLGAVARLLASALENVEFRTDEALRERLRSRSHASDL
ncbi:MAG: cyclic nucleotide-binding domain-containing protein [Elusimicrobia bacterium]|nr:cyclic nucleotide-binding domain-containing protein [Elusimicrobiota bacterium]